MNKIDLVSGFILGLAAALLGVYLFITFFTNFTFIAGLQILSTQGSLAKVITLGTISCLVVFGFLLKLNQEVMARGVVLAVIIIAIITLFI
jgi:hypothetical protein